MLRAQHESGSLTDVRVASRQHGEALGGDSAIRTSQDIVIKGKDYEAEPDLADITELEFTVQVKTPNYEIVVLPAISEPRRKGFLLFPVPPIRQGSVPLRVRCSARWPECVRGLRARDKYEEIGFTLPRGLTEPINKLTVTLRLEVPGAVFSVSELFHRPGRRQSTVSLRGPGEHKLTLKDVPARTGIQFRVARTG